VKQNYNKKKLIFLTLDITLIGGVERMLSTLIPYIKYKNDYSVEIISFFNSNNAFKFSFDDICLKYYSSTKFDISTKINSCLTYFRLLISVLKLQKNKNTIYISTFPNISIFYLLFRGNKNLIITEHAQFDAHNKFVNKIRVLLYKKALCITVLTYDQYLVFSNFCNSSCINVIPNPIEGSQFKATYSGQNIISVGRLVPEKGYDKFIESLSIVRKTNPHFKALIIGSGPEKEYLLNLIQTLQLNDNIQIIENETNVIKYLVKSKVFVVTSSTESFGLAMLESLSVGVPIVSFDAGVGPRSLLINNYNGFLVEYGDVELLSKKIVTILNLNESEWNNLSVNAKKSSENYTINNIYPLWKTMLEKLA
jgi:glycosyltransferase involved in cell wall biosynthesis